MDLESLKQAMLAAKAAALEATDNKELQTAAAKAEKAYNDAVAAAESETDPEGTEDDPENVDESKFDDKTKKYIAKLRKESATHRTKAKDLASKHKSEQDRVKAILKAAGIESEDDKPEEKLKTLTADKQTLEFRNQVLASALEHGIPADQIDFYEFMLAKAINGLEEGEELPEETLVELVAKIKKSSTTKKANSTVGTGGQGTGNPPPGGDGKGQITLEKFCSMSITEKSKLFDSNRDLYTTLVTQARAKKKLV